MKNIIKCFAVAGLGCLLLPSCNNEKFLDVDQYDIVDIEAEFESDDNAFLGLNGIYAYNNVSSQDNSWGYKPNLFTGSHPTMDTQCTGWDVKFNDQTWDANVGELGEGWSHCYTAINRANLYLSGLEEATAISDATKKTCEGEARALRGYFYSWLATTFGRVPMLATGEDFSNTPNKAAAKTYDEMWSFIISDFQAASELLDWTPSSGSTNTPQYGRCTKGMAKAYLADALMWKAYRCPDKADSCYKAAAAALKDVLDHSSVKNGDKQLFSGNVYELSTNFATNWDPKGFWNKECIWAMVSDEGAEWSSRGSDRTITFCNPNMFKWFTACPENGGWGSQYLSWEWYASYEHGDLRRDASCATGAVDKKQMEKYGLEASDNVWGYNPYLQDSLGTDDGNGGVAATTKTKQFHFTNGEYAPAIWTTKFWRNAFADGNSWGTQMWSPTIIYGKRLSNVILDYAECLFRINGENDETAWALIDALRYRAFGNLAVGQNYDAYVTQINEVLKANGKDAITKYPLPTPTETVTVESAKEYYTTLQATPNRVGYKHTSPAWKVAINEERRKEFNSEWSLCPDMIKSGYIADHIDYNYPKDDGGSDYANYPWSKRTFTFDENKMDMPIPAAELMKNTLLEQNPGY